MPLLALSGGGGGNPPATTNPSAAAQAAAAQAADQAAADQAAGDDLLNRSPTGSIDDITINEDEYFDLPITDKFNDLDGDELTYMPLLKTLIDKSFSNGNKLLPLPSWLTFDGSNFTGTPSNSDVGEYDITVIIDDGSGGILFTDFKITVNNVNDAPTVIIPIDDITIEYGKDFNFSIVESFDDVDVGDTLTYTAKLANGNPLPLWLIFDPTTGIFTGTLLIDHVGDLDVSVYATDNEGAETVNHSTIIVSVNEPPNPPVIVNITSSAEDGYYEAYDSIGLSVHVDSEMTLGSTIRMTLETGLVDRIITLTRDPINATIYTGTYTVQPSDTSYDLSVNSIDPDTATDLAGNALNTEIPDGYNLDDNSDLLIMRTITGTNDDDWIYDSNGSNVIYTIQGDDVIYGNMGNDHLHGGEDNDQLYGGLGDDELYGDENDDILYGGAGHDYLHGNNGHDFLYGNSGNDFLIGEAGMDQIYGGSGDDLLKGGSDSDIFWYNDVNDGNDVILDFTLDEDLIHLANLLSYNSNDGDIISDFINITIGPITLPIGGVGTVYNDFIMNIDANGDG